jgi:hypothetical protein
LSIFDSVKQNMFDSRESAPQPAELPGDPDDRDTPP